MSEVILVTATCAQCAGRLKGWYDDHTEPAAGAYVHLGIGNENPDEHTPDVAAGSVRLTDYDLWHVLPGMGW